MAIGSLPLPDATMFGWFASSVKAGRRPHRFQDPFRARASCHELRLAH